MNTLYSLRCQLVNHQRPADYSRPAQFCGRREASYGAELGFWPLEDLRLGIGYNFTGYRDLVSGPTNTGASNRQGAYFSLTAKLSNLFNLFSTPRQRIAGMYRGGFTEFCWFRVEDQLTVTVAGKRSLVQGVTIKPLLQAADQDLTAYRTCATV